MDSKILFNMIRDYSWLEKRYYRSVNNLHLWDENPRLDLSNNFSSFRDIVEGLIYTDNDRKDFLDLAKSIAMKSFIPADPIVIWQNQKSEKFYVAEGNRRVAVLKLLLNPHKAPISIKTTFSRLSKLIDHSRIEKIPVAIAPSFQDSLWYINQRHTPSANQKKWSRENQMAWIAQLYRDFNGDISLIQEFADVTEGELNKLIGVLKLKEYISELTGYLTDEELKIATSPKFPISTFERFVNRNFVQDYMGFAFKENDIEINAEKESFLNSFSILIRRLILPKDDPNSLNSRKLNSEDDIRKELLKLPEIIKHDDTLKIDPKEKEGTPDEETHSDFEEPIRNPLIEKTPTRPMKNDTNRNRLVLQIYTLNTDDYRLIAIFEELKLIPIKYNNAIAASIRIFLDIAIRNYIVSNDLEKDICKENGSALRYIVLSSRIKFIKDKLNKDSKQILNKLLDSDYQYSLDVLNGYIHSSKTYTINPQYLNSFWDFLFPVFEEILDIKEI